MRCNSTATFYLLAVYLFIRVSSFIDSGKLHGHRYNEHFAKDGSRALRHAKLLKFGIFTAFTFKQLISCK